MIPMHPQQNITCHLRGKVKGVGVVEPYGKPASVKWTNDCDTIHPPRDYHNIKMWEMRGRKDEAEVLVIIT